MHLKSVLDMSDSKDFAFDFGDGECSRRSVSPSCYVPGDPDEPVDDMLRAAASAGCQGVAQSGFACLDFIDGALGAGSRDVAMWLYSKAVGAASTTRTDAPAVYDRLMGKLRGVYEMIETRYPKVEVASDPAKQLVTKDVEEAAAVASDLVNAKALGVEVAITTTPEKREKIVTWAKRVGIAGAALGAMYIFIIAAGGE